MNKEEFIKEYSDKFEDVLAICFSGKENPMYTTLSDNPKEYVDIASKCTGLKHIVLEDAQTSDYYKSIIDFVRNSSDDVKIINGPVGKASKEEFLKSEQIIEGIVDEINPEWTIKQKAAYVHYKMGEMISYTPDFCFSGKYATDSKAKSTRNIWKSIESGESVCNGIATIERNILSRIGVKTRELSSVIHSFVMIESEEGNILSDPTWDLTNALFEGRPMYFGKTYEQLREWDGPLSKAHKLNNEPENVIGIDEEELREIYHSIGFTTEDRKFKFPILDKVNEINSKQFESSNERIRAFLQMFSTEFTSQLTHLSETRTMLERCMPELGIDDKNLTTKFVYLKEDEESQNPYLCLHINDEEMKNEIAILNTDNMQFEYVDLKSFDQLYKQHDLDTREAFWKKYLQREEMAVEQEKDK